MKKFSIGDRVISGKFVGWVGYVHESKKEVSITNSSDGSRKTFPYSLVEHLPPTNPVDHTPAQFSFNMLMAMIKNDCLPRLD